MRVELLYADGDPAAMPARQNLVEVLTEDAFETPIQMISVASRENRSIYRAETFSGRRCQRPSDAAIAHDLSPTT